jgi:hypothetical protein
MALTETEPPQYAEAEDFFSAVMWEEKEFRVLRRDEEADRKDFNARLELYKAKKPYRMEAKPKIVGDRAKD